MGFDNSLGILIVGHGTRRKSGQEQFLKLFRHIAELFDENHIAPSFLELAEPTIEQGLEKLAYLGVRRVLVTPILLFRAGHAIEDIPEAVNAAAQSLQLEIVGQTPPLNCHEAVVRLSAHRFRQAVCVSGDRQTQEISPLCDGCATRSFCGKTALLMIGRGSNSPSATQTMLQFAEARKKLTQVEHFQTAFIHGQSPTVEEGFHWLSKQDTPLAVVQPHLLFPGLLSQELRDMVAQWQAEQPHRKWIMADVLGADQCLAETFAELIKEEAY